MKVLAVLFLLGLLGNRALGQTAAGGADDDSSQCIISGDPHMKTYDGLVGFSAGVCSYLLTNVGPGDILVYMETEDRGEESKSWLKTISYETAAITIVITNTTIDIGGSVYDLADFTKDTQGDLTIEKTDVRTCITKADDDDSDDEPEIEVCAYFAYPRAAATITLYDDDVVEGACGNNNEVKEDDYNNPQGVAEDTFGDMVASWKDESGGACPKA